MACGRFACVAVGVLCLAFGVLSQARAATAPRGRVVLHVDPCFATNEASVASILSVEIGQPVKRVDAGVAEAAAHEPSTVVVRVTCEGPGLIHVQAQGAIAGRRRVDLVAVDARVRARVVALAVAEFFEPAPVAPPPPARPTPAAAVVAPSVTPMPATRVLLAHASARRFLQSEHTSYGGGLGLWVSHKAWFATWTDVAAEQGRAQRAAGAVLLRSISVRAGASWQRSFSHVGVALGAGGVVGFVRAEGEPRDATATPATVSGAWAGGLARADLFYDLGRARLQAFAEGGHTLLTIRGRFDAIDQDLWRNPWVSVGLAGGWRF